MKKRLPFIVTAILMVLIAFGPPVLFFISLEKYFEINNESSKILSLSLFLCSWGSVELSSEFTARYGPKPFTARLTKIAHRVTQIRDRLIFITAIALALTIAYLPALVVQFPQPWIGLLSMVTGILAFYGFCFIFGTNELRAFLNIKPKKAKTLLRPNFVHEKLTCVLVGEKSEFKQFDYLVSEINSHGYQTSDKTWMEGDAQEFSIHWLERQHDQLVLQSATHEGIKLFGPANLLAEFQYLAVENKSDDH